MGQTLSNCIPQFPTQTTAPSPVEEVTDEYSKNVAPAPTDSETGADARGLKLQKPKTATPTSTSVSSPDNQLGDGLTTTAPNKKQLPTKPLTTPTLTTQATLSTAVTTAATTEQDFFSDMKPKYAPPPMVNPKQVSRLTMDDTDNATHSGWDTEDNDRTPKLDHSPKKKDVKQKSKLDSTTTSESFDDFDD